MEGLVPISQLRGYDFYIPDYQRGYRWQEKQVTQLLDDIWEFSLKNKKSGKAIYCIQPLVVSKRKELGDRWVVVDGQQRLTTLFIILRCLNRGEQTYQLEYQTRPDSAAFLQDIHKKGMQQKEEENIDYFHMIRAYNAVKEWVEGKKVNKYELTARILQQVHFIWYDISALSDGVPDLSLEVETFSRINKGKIPLTEAELVKALFLNREKYPKKEDPLLETIASKWDAMENTLQDDEFWSFVCGGEEGSVTRIDFLLDLIRMQHQEGDNQAQSPIHSGDHPVFEFFDGILSEKGKEYENLGTLWQELEEVYEVLLEWYRDYRMYHYIGYLSTMAAREKRSAVSVIQNAWSEWKKAKQSKEQFLQYLTDEVVQTLWRKGWIKQTVKWAWENASYLTDEERMDAFKEYCFDEDNPTQGPVKGRGKNDAKTQAVGLLLLHNVETILQQNRKFIEESKYNLPNFSKFPFHLFQREKWDVEHIRPNAGDDDDEKSQVLYALSLLDFYEKGSEPYNDARQYLDGQREDLPTSDLELGEEKKNTLYNFVLLDSSTNREYHNVPYPVKREFISWKEKGQKIGYELVEKDKSKKPDGELKGSYRGKELYRTQEEAVAFIPPCTKNVFTKFYTDMPSSMLHWNEEDAAAYWQNMKQTLKSFFLELLKKGEKNA